MDECLSVAAQTIAQWYYWRWRIENYFKLLKSAGQHLEEWQQTTAKAIASRLLVAATACVVVWRWRAPKLRRPNPAAVFGPPERAVDETEQ